MTCRSELASVFWLVLALLSDGCTSHKSKPDAGVPSVQTRVVTSRTPPVAAQPSLVLERPPGFPSVPIFSKFVPDGNTASVESVVQALSAAPINTVSTTIAWRVVEPVEGKLDLAPYFPFLDGLVAKGYRLIVVLDSSGRGMLNAQRAVTATPAFPGWLVDKAPEALAKDFFGGEASQLDYFEPDHFRFLQRFYEYTLDVLKARYRENIIAVAPGIMSELEIKYFQTSRRLRGDKMRARRSVTGAAQTSS